MRTPLVRPLVRFSESCALTAVFSICCAQQSCAVSSTERVRQHHRLFWPDSNQSLVHLCSSAGVFVRIVLVDADHVCMCICNVSQVLTGTQPCVAMLSLCPDCCFYNVDKAHQAPSRCALSALEKQQSGHMPTERKRSELGQPDA